MSCTNSHFVIISIGPQVEVLPVCDLLHLSFLPFSVYFKLIVVAMVKVIGISAGQKKREGKNEQKKEKNAETKDVLQLVTGNKSQSCCKA